MRVFITGISGLLGLNLAMMLQDRAEVVGAYGRHRVGIDRVEAHQVDALLPGAMERTILAAEPEVIIHTAGLTVVEECESAPGLAQRLNVDLAAEVAAASTRTGARLVHLSSDHLFGGTAPWHREEEPPHPLNEYARTKASAEILVRQAAPDALIIRTNFYGPGLPHRPSFSDWVLDGLRTGRELPMFTDVYFTPMLIQDLGEIIIDLLTAGITGLYHVAGSERTSKYDFAVRVGEVFEISLPRIRPATVLKAPLRARRPHDMSLATDKAVRRLGRRMPSVDEGLHRLRALEAGGWPARLRAAALDQG